MSDSHIESSDKDKRKGSQRAVADRSVEVEESQGQGVMADGSNEVEVVGWYSGKPCSSSSDAAFVTDPLPLQLPKVEVVNEDEVVPDPVNCPDSPDNPDSPEVALVTSSDDDEDSDVEELGFVIADVYTILRDDDFTTANVELDTPDQISVTVNVIDESSSATETEICKKSTDNNGTKENAAAENCGNETLPGTGAFPRSASPQAVNKPTPIMIDIADDDDDDDDEIKDETETTTTNGPKESSVSCFNCAGNHFLDKCPVEHNFDTIRKKDQAFNASKRNAQVNSSADCYKSLEEKYANMNIRPGSISEDLRNALGLRPDQLPPYIYKMRQHGYPPGWLEKAARPSPGFRNSSEGYAESEDPPRYLRLDKLHDYPGFTLPVPIGFKDESKRYRQARFYYHTLKHIKKEWEELEGGETRNDPSLLHSWSSEIPKSPPLMVRNPLCTTNPPSKAGRQTSNKVTKRPWYTDIVGSEPYSTIGGEISSTVRRNSDADANVNRLWVRNSYGKLELSPHIKSVAEYTGATRNYHVTAELERRQEEEKKRKLDQMKGKKRPQDDSSGSDYYEKRSPSPSVLEEFPTVKPTKRQKSATRSRAFPKADVEEDNDVIIVEHVECNNQQSTVQLEIIELDSPPPSEDEKSEYK